MTSREGFAASSSACHALVRSAVPSVSLMSSSFFLFSPSFLIPCSRSVAATPPAS